MSHSHTTLTDKPKMLQAVIYNALPVSVDLTNSGSSLVHDLFHVVNLDIWIKISVSHKSRAKLHSKTRNGYRQVGKNEAMTTVISIIGCNLSKILI